MEAIDSVPVMELEESKKKHEAIAKDLFDLRALIQSKIKMI